jgi:hypothetical protein
MAIGFDDLERRPGFFVTAKPERVSFLPEPGRRDRWCTEHATIEALTLEQCGRYHLECGAAGGTEILDAEGVAGEQMYCERYLPQMWDANLARLRASDPDLFCT